MQLEVEEHLAALARQPLGQGEASAGIDEFETDLVEADGVAEPIHQRLRRLDAGHIERHDQPVPRRKAHGELRREGCHDAT